MHFDHFGRTNLKIKIFKNISDRNKQTDSVSSRYVIKLLSEFNNPEFYIIGAVGAVNDLPDLLPDLCLPANILPPEYLQRGVETACPGIESGKS